MRVMKGQLGFQIFSCCLILLVPIMWYAVLLIFITAGPYGVYYIFYLKGVHEKKLAMKRTLCIVTAKSVIVYLRKLTDNKNGKYSYWGVCKEKYSDGIVAEMHSVIPLRHVNFDKDETFVNCFCVSRDDLGFQGPIYKVYSPDPTSTIEEINRLRDKLPTGNYVA